MNELIFNAVSLGILFCLTVYHLFLYIKFFKRRFVFFSLLLFSAILFVFFSSELYEQFFNYNSIVPFLPTILLVNCFIFIFAAVNFITDIFALPGSRLFTVYYFVQIFLILLVTVYMLIREQGYYESGEVITALVLANCIILALFSVLIALIVKNRTVQGGSRRLLFFAFVIFTLFMLAQILSYGIPALEFFQGNYLLMSIIMFIFSYGLLMDIEVAEIGQDEVKRIVDGEVKKVLAAKGALSRAAVEQREGKISPEEGERGAPESEPLRKEVVELSSLLSARFRALKREDEGLKGLSNIEEQLYVKENRAILERMVDSLLELSSNRGEEGFLNLILKAKEKKLELSLGELELNLQGGPLNSGALKLAEIRKLLTQLEGTLFIARNRYNEKRVSLKVILNRYILSEDEMAHYRGDEYRKGLKTILLLTDSGEMQAALEAALKPKYNLFDLADRGKLKESLLSLPRPELFIVDLESDGERDELLYELSQGENVQATPILLLTKGRPSFHNEVINLRRGRVDYLVKPFKPEELHSKVEELIKGLALRRERNLRRIEDKIEEAVKSEDNKESSFNRSFEDKCALYGFTRREAEAARQLLEGLEYREIAEKLVMTEERVIELMQSLFAKTEVETRIDFINIMSR